MRDKKQIREPVDLQKKKKRKQRSPAKVREYFKVVVPNILLPYNCLILLAGIWLDHRQHKSLMWLSKVGMLHQLHHEKGRDACLNGGGGPLLSIFPLPFHCVLFLFFFFFENKLFLPHVSLFFKN